MQLTEKVIATASVRQVDGQTTKSVGVGYNNGTTQANVALEQGVYTGKPQLRGSLAFDLPGDAAKVEASASTNGKPSATVTVPLFKSKGDDKKTLEPENRPLPDVFAKELEKAFGGLRLYKQVEHAEKEFDFTHARSQTAEKKAEPAPAIQRSPVPCVPF